ncbi:hypothetical protein [Asticcacaulis solisilvae]|uniref:hypothetical protein n=1 Tax=Asticcacaulis solisilvae TaxID=1217274 RepID=UPI003FD6F720
MTASPPDEYYGVLVRARFEEDRAVLQFHGFVFDGDSNNAPVYEVTFDSPSFGRGDVEPFLDQEVEFSRLSETARIHDVFAGQTLDLPSAQSRVKWQPYDLEDYAKRVKQLDLHISELHHDLKNCRVRLSKVHSTIIELLRRAEIKAGASSELNRLQKPVIEVLHRILSHLD